MKRRKFITLVGGMVIAWPLAARAQQREVARRMFFTTCVAGSFTGTDFCLIFAP